MALAPKLLFPRLDAKLCLAFMSTTDRQAASAPCNAKLWAEPGLPWDVAFFLLNGARTMARREHTCYAAVHHLASMYPASTSVAMASTPDPQFGTYLLQTGALHQASWQLSWRNP